MEALVLLILEGILAALAAPAFALAAALLAGLGSLVMILAELILPRLPSRRAAPVPARPRSRLLRRVLLGGTALIGLGLVLAQTVFFEPIVRRLCAAARDRAGIEAGFARASGNLLAGRVVLHEASLKRSTDPSSNFDLTAREIAVDVRTLSLLSGGISIESIRAAGVRGSYVKTSAPERPPRKPFRADVLLVEDARLDWTLKRPDRPDFTTTVHVDRLEARPFEARDAAFSILFRSDAAGSVGGAPFRITGEGDGDARRTTWTADGLPIRFLADFLGAPFDWLREGTADIRVTDAWRRGKTTEVDLAWKVVLHNPGAAVPERVTGLQRRVAEAVAAFLNRKPRDIPLEFTLTLDGDGFRGSMSVEALGLWKAVGEALVAELAEFAGLPPDVLRDWGRAGLEKLKGLLRRRAGH